MVPSSATKSRFSLTTPLYYVNDLPHVGSAYTTIAADVITRFYRLQGVPALLTTGTDEHGQKIQRTAQENGRTPQAHCDHVVAGFADLWQRLNIRPDRFIRTTDPRHTAIVQEFYQRVWDRGDIYLAQQQGWYCVACEEFKEERDLLISENGSEKQRFCAIHSNRAVEWRDEQNYFFKLSNYQEKLEALYAEKPDFIQPTMRRNEVLSFVQRGLQDFSISRINLDWGIPVPNDPTHTLYVWFDALLGYVTALLEPEDAPTLANATARWWPYNVHLIGKDILRFHAVYWPAMLLSAGLPLPDHVFGHGFLTKDGQKMGKSLGNVLDPYDLVDRYGADAVRYYFLREIEFGRDGDFSEPRFINVLNADLANDLGNLLNRTLRMTHKYCNGVVPAVEQATIAQSPPAQLAKDLGDRVQANYQRFAFSAACDAIVELMRVGNKYVDEQAPWALYKKGDQIAVAEILYVLLESVRLAAYLLSPITPELSSRVYAQLGFAIAFDSPNLSDLAPYTDHAKWGCLPPKQLLQEPKPVFQKLEPLETATV